jgi:hypothetical protein
MKKATFSFILCKRSIFVDRMQFFFDELNIMSGKKDIFLIHTTSILVEKKNMSISKLYIPESRNTPEIDFNPDDGVLILKGKSTPENATKIYEPILEWIKEYIQNPVEKTYLHLNLTYFNTSSSIWITRMIKALSKIDDRDKLLTINLYFHVEEYDEMDDEDVQDAIAMVLKVLNDATVSLGVKVYGIDDFGAILKERLILL